MKPFLIVLFLVVFCCCKSQPKVKTQNKIDDIHSSEQANQLLHALLGKGYEDYYVADALSYKGKEYKNLAEKIKAVSWVKADFDKNGYTDLLVVAEDTTTNIFWPDNRFIACIMDSGNNKFCVKHLTNSVYSPSVAVFKMIDKIPSLLYYDFQNPENKYFDTEGNKLPIKKSADTLIYKFADFVEYSKQPVHFNIQKIEFEASMCFGNCPSFKLTINADDSGEYDAGPDNEDKNGKKVSGESIAKIDSMNFKEINALLDYINFPNLKSRYAVNWTDDQTGTLKITYNNGQTKVIEDYGEQGTFGLKRLYQLLFALRLNQNWH